MYLEIMICNGVVPRVSRESPFEVRYGSHLMTFVHITATGIIKLPLVVTFKSPQSANVAALLRVELCVMLA